MWVVAVAMIFGCGGSKESEPFLFPAAIGATWKLVSSAPVPDSGVSAQAKKLGLRSATRAHYRGEGDLNVTVYQMTSQPGAFELNQKWPPAEGLLVFHKDALFVVLESPALDHHALTAVAEEFEELLEPPR
jgi:hypothetical protein